MAQRFEKFKYTKLFIMLFHKTQRRQSSLLSRFVIISIKTCTALYLFVYELGNYSSAKKNFP